MPDLELRKLQEDIERLKAELTTLKRDSNARRPGVLGRLAASPRLRIALVAVMVAIPLAAYAAQISIPYTFTNGTPANANEVNANFSALVGESNAQDTRLATIESNITTLQGQITTGFTTLTQHAANIAALQTGMGTNLANINANAASIATAGGDISTLQTDVGDNTTNINANGSDITVLNTTFADVSRVGSLLTFSGMNVRVVDGSGTTEGAVNGLGNLIVGYNENPIAATRTGSHNLVVGIDHEYTSYGGMVIGKRSTISAAFASVSGGWFNTASGTHSQVSGGYLNTASNNISSVSGGWGNTASGSASSVSGGRNNTANSFESSVSGGWGNTASGPDSSVTGGQGNTASADYSSISGGNGAGASGAHDWATGGVSLAGNLFTFSGMNVQVVSGSGSTDGTVNGVGNLIVGYNEDGAAATRTGSHNLVVGIDHEYTSFGGLVAGAVNTISAAFASVSGGTRNTASGLASSVSGGDENTASANYSNVSGGDENTASGSWSSVSGGYRNTANGVTSTIGGGTNRSVTGNDDWRAGSLFEPF
jgi:hypothetical protein